MADTPIKYITTEKSLVGNELFEAGAEVVLPEGTLPAANMQATCARGEAKKAEYEASNRERIARLADQYSDTASTAQMEAMSKMVAKAVTEALAEQRRVDAELAEAATVAKTPKKSKAADDANLA